MTSTFYVNGDGYLLPHQEMRLRVHVTMFLDEIIDALIDTSGRMDAGIRRVEAGQRGYLTDQNEKFQGLSIRIRKYILDELIPFKNVAPIDDVEQE